MEKLKNKIKFRKALVSFLAVLAIVVVWLIPELQWYYSGLLTLVIIITTVMVVGMAESELFSDNPNQLEIPFPNPVEEQTFDFPLKPKRSCRNCRHYIPFGKTGICDETQNDNLKAFPFKNTKCEHYSFYVNMTNK